MKVKTTRCVTHSLELDDGSEVGLDFEPYSEPMIHQTDTHLIVAYLVQDDNTENPLESHDSQGTIHLAKERNCRMTNLRAVLGSLHLHDQNDPDVDFEFELDGLATTLRGLAEESIEAQHSDDPERDVETLSALLYQQHWKAVVGPYVVPLSYCDAAHGPGTMTCSPTTWDGDPDDLPDGVWVADSGAQENIDWREDGEAAIGELTLRQRAFDYAKSVCSEFEDWCNGNVFGCVCEVFKRPPNDPFKADGAPWEKIEDEDLEHSCWGFIGVDYAKQELKEQFFDPAVKEYS